MQFSRCCSCLFICSSSCLNGKVKTVIHWKEKTIRHGSSCWCVCSVTLGSSSAASDSLPFYFQKPHAYCSWACPRWVFCLFFQIVQNTLDSWRYLRHTLQVVRWHFYLLSGLCVFSLKLVRVKFFSFLCFS